MPGGIRPFRQFILKVHSRCDLACDHCYVYEHADQSWRTRPKVIAQAVVKQAGARIAEHARQHHLPEVQVVLHGGEPLLAGAQRLSDIASALRAAIEPSCTLDLRIHTNGVRLNEEFCELFLAERIKVGVSLDGDQAANDLHRRFADGRSSYDLAVQAIDLLRQDRYRELLRGALVHRRRPQRPARRLPKRWRASSRRPSTFCFRTLPGTPRRPAWRPARPRTPTGSQRSSAPGRPTAAAFPSASSIRSSRPRAGGASRAESLGLEASELLVIETDGTLEQADSIKVAFDGAPATGLDLFAHSLNEAAAHPAIRARQQGLAGVSQTCRQCPVVTSCGGGLYAHRYRSATGFDNPSVYCADLKKIITHIQVDLRPAATARPHSAHALTGGQFDSLAAGFGDPGAIGELARAQRSLRRAQLELLRKRADSAADREFLVGWDLLAQVERTTPTPSASCSPTRTCAPGPIAVWAAPRRPCPAAEASGAPGRHRRGGGDHGRCSDRDRRPGHRRLRLPAHAGQAARRRADRDRGGHRGRL